MDGFVNNARIQRGLRIQSLNLWPALYLFTSCTLQQISVCLNLLVNPVGLDTSHNAKLDAKVPVTPKAKHLLKGSQMSC